MVPATRYAAIDALRGLIMMIMAIDHSSAFIARQHSTEFWNGAVSIHSSAFAFLTRWITHLCAPGFFFLMGAGIYWFAASRQEAGWTTTRTIRRTALRGFAIFLLGQFLENPIIYLQGLLKPAAAGLSRLPMPPPNDGTSVLWGFVTLSCLGVVMMACAALLAGRAFLWLVVAALCVWSTHVLLPASGKVGPLWQAILLAPGLSQHVLAVYPVIPWLAVAAFGMYFGHWWRGNPQAPRQIWWLGLALITIALTLRGLGGWGNIVPARDGSWIEFLNNVKYPPSLVFWTLSVGLNLLLLSLLIRLPEALRSARSPLVVFGQTPLFFYLAHFAVLALFAFTLFPEAASLGAAYGMWIVVLAVLYPVCLRYRSFKLAQPAESLWRIF